ncbi:MAG: hypothetical protein M3315_12090 [Actinomycetota bacterium]|nr:hypothetical protein [Actinomycetota bacterium]
MAEYTPPTPEQSRQLNRSLTEKVLDMAASDPAWRQQLLDDPQAAMRAANFPELKRVEEMRQSMKTSPPAAEVGGHVMTNPYELTSRQQGFCCQFYTLGQTNY